MKILQCSSFGGHNCDLMANDVYTHPPKLKAKLKGGIKYRMEMTIVPDMLKRQLKRLGKGGVEGTGQGARTP